MKWLRRPGLLLPDSDLADVPGGPLLILPDGSLAPIPGGPPDIWGEGAEGAMAPGDRVLAFPGGEAIADRDGRPLAVRAEGRGWAPWASLPQARERPEGAGGGWEGMPHEEPQAIPLPFPFDLT